MNRTKRVVAYVRVSTAEQDKNGYGIRIQCRDVRAFAKRQDLDLRRIYADRAESGILEDRTELQRLLRDCERGRVSAVIIPCIDRLSRDVRIAENLFWTFERLGVRVLITDMPHYDGNNRKDVLIRQIREAIAEENRKEIIERLWKGRQERVRNGRPPGGTVPYGYCRRGGRFKLHATEASVVRMIFTLADEKVCDRHIAETLNAQGYRRRNGASWTRRQVLAIKQRRTLYEHGIFRYGTITTASENFILAAKQK